MYRSLHSCLLLLGLLAMTCVAHAAPRAWLDRDRIELGETVTLNVEADLMAAAPDYGPLEGDFDVSGHSSRHSYVAGSNGTRTTTLFAVALRPRQDGVLTIPALQVGAERTAPLSLVVAPARVSAPAGARGDVFIESRADDTAPYVQQSVGWVVRLFSAVPIVSGTLDQPAPDGASLRRTGDDVQYSRTIDGRQYQVVERRFMLVPERSGSLSMPAATFEGRGTAGLFDDMFGSGRGSRLSARGDGTTLRVQAIPASAPQPWLPLHGLELRYRANPTRLLQGEAATLTIEAVADGATGAQMPDLVLPPIEGVQVFPEKAQVDERFVDGRPRTTVTRRFSLVPNRDGPVRLSGVGMAWWDVAAGKPRKTELPALDWTVDAAGRLPPSGQIAPTADAPAVGGDAAEAPSSPPIQLAATPATGDHGRVWMFAAVAFAMLWLITLLLALHWRSGRAGPTAPGAGLSGRSAGEHAPPAPGVLRKALDTGDFDDVARALCAAAIPPARDLDAVRQRLEDPAQRDAVDALQRARWADGDGPDARRRLRDAFAGGPRWRDVEGPATPALLAPLYPPSRTR